MTVFCQLPGGTRGTREEHRKSQEKPGRSWEAHGQQAQTQKTAGVLQGERGVVRAVRLSCSCDRGCSFDALPFRKAQKNVFTGPVLSKNTHSQGRTLQQDRQCNCTNCSTPSLIIVAV